MTDHQPSTTTSSSNTNEMNRQQQQRAGATTIMMTVPTKDPDSEDHRSGIATSKLEDHFLYYSNDEVRMNALRNDTQDQQPQEPPHFHEVQRKTCISFELHPSKALFTPDDDDDNDDIDFDALLDQFIARAA